MRRTLVLLLAAMALLVVQATGGWAQLAAKTPCADCPAMTEMDRGCGGVGDGGGGCDGMPDCDALACRAACPTAVGALPATHCGTLALPAKDEPSALRVRDLVGLSGPPDPFPPRA